MRRLSCGSSKVRQSQLIAFFPNCSILQLPSNSAIRPIQHSMCLQIALGWLASLPDGGERVSHSSLPREKQNPRPPDDRVRTFLSRHSGAGFPCYRHRGGCVFKSVCFSVHLTLCKHYSTDFHETWWQPGAWAKKEPMLGHRAVP